MHAGILSSRLKSITFSLFKAKQLPTMPPYSSGLLLFRLRNDRHQVLLVHPGGPFWEKKDENAWSIPKGLMEENEDSLQAAKREFLEETGFNVDGEFIDLEEIKQPSGKMIHVYALEKDLDVTMVVSNKFSLEWPKKSGIMKEYPEIDRADWFDIEQTKKKIHKGQIPFIERLVEIWKAGSKNGVNMEDMEKSSARQKSRRPAHRAN
jgi:predicted NUDIX family NTP pyrophosphohydrolase